MKKVLLLILIFSPLNLIGQELECCKTEKDVETYLSGDWKKKDSDLNRLYRNEFKNGKGKFKVFVINEDGTLKPAEENVPEIRILKKDYGFEIEHDFGVVKTITGIKYLDSNKLIVTRRDGAETEYYKIIE
jgi:hypothetical protein